MTANTLRATTLIEERQIEETIGEQLNFYLFAKQCTNLELLDGLWADKFAHRVDYRFSDIALETEWLDESQLYGADVQQAEIYLGHQIFKYKLRTGSFADPDLAAYVRQIGGLALLGTLA